MCQWAEGQRSRLLDQQRVLVRSLLGVSFKGSDVIPQPVEPAALRLIPYCKIKTVEQTSVRCTMYTMQLWVQHATKWGFPTTAESLSQFSNHAQSKVRVFYGGHSSRLQYSVILLKSYRLSSLRNYQSCHLQPICHVYKSCWFAAETLTLFCAWLRKWFILLPVIWSYCNETPILALKTVANEKRQQ